MLSLYRPLLAILLLALPLQANATSLTAGSVLTSPLSVSQAEQAVAGAIKAMGRKADARVYDVIACVPAFKKPQRTWSCVIDLDVPGRGRRMTVPYVFRQQGETWSMNPETDAVGACAPNEVVQTAFRAARNDPALHVSHEAGRGEGIFTDERGISRDQKGPMRLMCRYAVRTGRGEELLFVTYLRHDGASYVIDPDWEIWDE